MAEFNMGNDITTPEGVAAEAEALVEGMRQQAAASRSGTALGGHPNPQWFYTRVADVLQASASLIKTQKDLLAVQVAAMEVATKPDDAGVTVKKK